VQRYKKIMKPPKSKARSSLKFVKKLNKVDKTDKKNSQITNHKMDVTPPLMTNDSYDR
jgi:hypothetical protein